MIRKLFQYLFGWPHDHDWELLSDNWHEEWQYPNGKQQLVAKLHVWTYRCKLCGKGNKIDSRP